MSGAVIEVKGLSRTYKVGDVEVRALDGVDLRVEEGDFVAIMGASGSGKSTLMAILGCLDRPTSGSYRLEGFDVALLSDADLARLRNERLGFVFQSFNLLPRTSALENVALPLFYRQMGQLGRRERAERARAALNRLGLAGRDHSTPGQLSGGQQQRVAIARALINSPNLLLADEPTGNLDTKTSHEIMETLAALNRSQGVTIVVVTHESDIAAYADRVITMRDGTVISDQMSKKEAPKPLSSAADLPPSTTTEVAGARIATSSWAFGGMILGAATQALVRNMMRSALTMLGIFIGVAALITMVAVGQGANEAVRKQIESLGSNLLVILPGATTANGVRAGFGSASTITVGDAAAIRRDDNAIGEVSYLIRQSGQTQFGNQNWMTSIQGVTDNYPAMTNWTIDSGRGISSEDEDRAALVVVLGQTVYRQLFSSDESAVGAVVSVKGVPLRVIGLLTAKGQTAFGQDQDDLVMIPFSTAEQKVLGVAAPSQQQVAVNWIYPPPVNPFGIQPRLTGFVNQIYAQAVSPDLVPTAVAQAMRTLAERHHIKAGEPQDFSIRNLSQIVQAAEGSSRIMALLLAAVASISLLVGGVGIMNILLVSVTERTREIGLRMAIGARRMHVLMQFLTEALLLSLMGGATGILFGVAASGVISFFAGWPTQLSATAAMIGFGFAAAVGIFFGYYPARKAAALDPIQALRYE
jgi:macrolide transport system ATP-binding/permease protein